MEEADKCLGVTYNEGENGILSRNISKKREEISSIDRYKSEVFSNMALATTRLWAIFELIDIEIDNKESVRAFASYLKEKHGGIDILINNAAILLYVKYLFI